MKWIQGKVVGQTEWAPGLFSLMIEAPAFDFIPGQFVQLSLDEGQKLFRPYSLLNTPDDNVIEIYYSLVKNGALSPRLTALSLNDKIWLSAKASGRFVLNEVQNADVLWCFATGTGLGPFISILKTKAVWERFSKVVLAHSVRYINELTHQLLIETWQENYATQFHWCPFVSREPCAHARHARITSHLENKALEQSLGIDLNKTNSQVMLCGNPAMVLDATQILTQRGLEMNHVNVKGQITIENYWKLTN